MRIARCLALVASVTAAATTVAQEPTARFHGLVEVSEVFLDVLATDRRGDLVEGLGPEDFVVEEDGREVEITGVSFYSTRYGEGGERLGGVEEAPSSRYFVFFFHDLGYTGFLGTSLTRELFAAGRDAERWIMEEMLPSDWAAVATYDFKLKLHQDFTQDRSAIAGAIHRAVRRQKPPEVRPSERRPPAPGLPALARYLPQPPALGRETKNIHDGLRLLAEASGYLVGRKNLLLFTLGFGREDGNFRVSRPDPRYYPDLEAALNDHNVAVYPIDLTPPPNRALQPSFLNQLADDTGGRYQEGFVNYAAPLRLISDENVGYYLLSYRSEHPAGEVGYQRVTVRARPDGVRVRARRGYVYGR